MKLKVGDVILIKPWDQLEKEFGVYKSGDIKTKPCINKTMRQWCGKFCTIAAVSGNTYRIKEDYERWCWSDDMFDLKKECIVLYRDSNKVIGLHKIDGKITTNSEAKCNSIDKFDFSIGATIAFNRLFEIEGQNPEDDNQIKIGDRVKIIDPEESYTTYVSWFEKYEPSLSVYYPFGHTPDRGTYGNVRAMHMHENNQDMVYAIQADNLSVYLVHQDGIEKIDN